MALSNITEKALGEIWREAPSPFFLFRLKDPETGIGTYQECQHLANCKDCRSRIFVLIGDWFASDPVCPLCLKLVGKEVG